MDAQNRVFVGGIPVRVDKKAIIDFFGQFGKIKYCKVKKNSKTGRSLGYAYLTFEGPEALQELVNRQIEFCGRICECKQVFRKTELKEELAKEKRRKLLVFDLDQKTTNVDLKAYFESLTSISHAYVVKDPESVLNKGYGYVVFNKEEDLVAFCDKQLALSIDGRPIKYSKDFHIPPKKKEQSARPISHMSEKGSAQTVNKRAGARAYIVREINEKRSRSASVHESDGVSQSNSSESKSFDLHPSNNGHCNQNGKSTSNGNGNGHSHSLNGNGHSNNENGHSNNGHGHCHSAPGHANGQSLVAADTGSSMPQASKKASYNETSHLKAKALSASRSMKPINLPNEDKTGGTKSTGGSKTNCFDKSFKSSTKKTLWVQIFKASSQIDQRASNYKFNWVQYQLGYMSPTILLQ